MTKVENIWPLTVVSLPKDTALQKQPALRFTPLNRHETVVLDKLVGKRSDVSWQKGTFVDLYI